MKKAFLLINSISENPGKDELDVLVQAEAVEKSLEILDFRYHRLFFDLNLENTRLILEKDPPDMVFNLVETVAGRGDLIHLAPSLLESMGIPFTGSGSYALLMTTDKIRTKKILRENGIFTPDWFVQNDLEKPDKRKKYILKPAREDGSAGITDESIIAGDSIDLKEFSRKKEMKNWFLEEFIQGREFNLSLIGGKGGLIVLPAAEMQYIGYPKNKPKILNFASKWDEESFEYHHTIRTFDLPAKDHDLITEMTNICYNCREIFELKGYARVDFRVDENNRPYVLEVNINPCLSPDAGFPAACQKAGMSYTEMIDRIIYDAFI